MDRGGRVLSYRIVESSGYKLLDDEVVAMIERASPLPTPPAAMEGERFNYRIPALFDHRRARSPQSPTCHRAVAPASTKRSIRRASDRSDMAMRFLTPPHNYTTPPP